MRELLTEELRDLMNAEAKIVKALPKMIQNASSEPAKMAETHLAQTKTHVDRLHEARGILGIKAKDRTYRGMAGINGRGRSHPERVEGQRYAILH